jgi:hypothetical protein
LGFYHPKSCLKKQDLKQDPLEKIKKSNPPEQNPLEKNQKIKSPEPVADQTQVGQTGAGHGSVA